MEVARLDHLTKKVRRFLWDLLLLTLIIALFLGLGFWHASLGGFDTTPGTLVGLAFLFLLFSPLIDWVLAGIYKARETAWFGSVLGLIGLGRLLVAVGGVIALLLLFLTSGSWSTLRDMLRRALDAALP